MKWDALLSGSVSETHWSESGIGGCPTGLHATGRILEVPMERAETHPVKPAVNRCELRSGWKFCLARKFAIQCQCNKVSYFALKIYSYTVSNQATFDVQMLALSVSPSSIFSREVHFLSSLPAKFYGAVHVFHALIPRLLRPLATLLKSEKTESKLGISGTGVLAEFVKSWIHCDRCLFWCHKTCWGAGGNFAQLC